jgi:hypothetical protein
MDPIPGFALAFLVVLLYGGLWVGVLVLAAHASGWAALARAYRRPAPFRGQVWRLPNCRLTRMKWREYEGALVAFFPFLPLDITDDQLGAAAGELTVGGDPEGLYLAEPHLLFRPGHPPVFVPWGDVAVTPRRAPWYEELRRQFSGRYWPAEQAPPAGAGAGEFGDRTYWVFRFRRAPGVLLQLRESDGRRLAAAAAGSWPGELPSPHHPVAPDG